MLAISINDLSLSYGTTPILQSVSFSLEENDKLGIIGVNGCGKSTLFRLILGEEEPTSGGVYISKGKTVGVLTQEGAFDSEEGERNVLDRMYEAFRHLLAMETRLAVLEPQLGEGRTEVIREYTDLHDRYVREGGLEFRGRCVSILQKLGFDRAAMEQSVATLSGGQRTRLALAIELSREPDILMLDEPTNHLDIATLAWLESFLVSYPKCVMVISHDRYFLDRVTNKTLAIEHHRAKLYQGGYTKSMEQRRIDREIAERHWKNQQREIARQEAYIAQQRAWNRERNIIAAESRQKLLDKMERVERPQDAPKGIRMRFSEGLASGNDVLDVRGLSMGYAERTLFEDLSFLIKRQERVLIIGPNGCGKSTLIKLILGKLAPLGGVIECGYNVEIGYYDQENQNLTPENSVLDELWNAYPTMTETEVRSALGRFRFVGEDVYKTVAVLSGGERARLTLCKLILSKMNLLVLDEPTNHLDIDSREALEAALEEFDGTVLAVSHDRYFIEKLATRIVEIAPGCGLTKPLGRENDPSDMTDYRVTRRGEAYTEYCRFRDNRPVSASRPSAMSVTASGDATPKNAKEAYLESKQSAAEARKKKNRLERLHRMAEALEQEIEQIDEALAGPDGTDYKKAAALDERKTHAEEELLAVYEELETLESEG